MSSELVTCSSDSQVSSCGSCPTPVDAILQFFSMDVGVKDIFYFILRHAGIQAILYRHFSRD